MNLKLGAKGLGFLGQIGRKGLSRLRRAGRGGTRVLYLRSGSGGIYFKTKKGSAYGTSDASLKASLYKRTEAPQYICKVYYNGSLVGGTMSRTGDLAGMVPVINANTTGSLNSNIEARLIGEVNGVFQASNSLANSVEFTRI